MAILRIRPIDMKVAAYDELYAEVIKADLSVPPLDPWTLAIYQKLKQLQAEAAVDDYDLDEQRASHLDADRDANA